LHQRKSGLIHGQDYWIYFCIKKIREIKPSVFTFLLYFPLFYSEALDGSHCHTFLADLEMKMMCFTSSAATKKSDILDPLLQGLDSVFTPTRRMD